MPPYPSFPPSGGTAQLYLTNSSGRWRHTVSHLTRSHWLSHRAPMDDGSVTTTGEMTVSPLLTAGARLLGLRCNFSVNRPRDHAKQDWLGLVVGQQRELASGPVDADASHAKVVVIQHGDCALVDPG